MEIVIIDDGIETGFIQLPHISGVYQVLPNGQIKSGKSSLGLLTHGTICAAIIGQINPDVELIDLQILDKERKSSIDELVIALNWCYEHSVRLIHMSLGTLNYFDSNKLSEIVNKLLLKDVILVSAYHNKNIISYPAAIPGVFGVRSDRAGLLNEEYAIDVCDGLFPENCLVARFGKPLVTYRNEYISTELSNSFAAPVITSHISLYQQNHKESTRADVVSHVLSTAKPYTSNTNKICSYIHCDEQPIKSLVIGGMFSNNCIISQLCNLFKEDDYHVVSFSDNVAEITGMSIIPLSNYCTLQQAIDKNTLYTLEFIYKPDIMIIYLDSNTVNTSIDWNIWDAYITVQNKKIILTIERGSIEYYSIKDLYNGIIKYF